MNNVKSIQKLNEEELRLGIQGRASWHAEYANSAYIHIGGLPFAMNEGDLSVVFSQCGEIIDCNLVRDSETGKSKGFAFIGFADQRSTILAVDNLNGTSLCGRIIKVDHVSKYKLPKEYRDDEKKILINPTGPDGQGWGEFKRLTKETLQEHDGFVADSELIWERNFMKQVKSEAKEKNPKNKHKHIKIHKKTDKEKAYKKSV